MAVVRFPKLDILKRTSLLGDFPWLVSGLGLVLGVSLFISVLALSQPLYMMSLYDRVLSSLSRDTLIALTVIALFLLVVLGVLESYRSRLLGRLADAFDERVRPRLFPIMVRLNLDTKAGSKAFASLDVVKGFLNSSSPAHLMDLPFTPLYLAVLFALHPILGFVSLFAAAAMGFMGYRLETHYKVSIRKAQYASRVAMSVADSAVRSAEVVASMGMMSAFQAHWMSLHEQANVNERAAADEMAGVSGILKAGTLVAQTVVLGLACYLVLEDQASVGAMFAANVLVSRLVAPMQQAMMAWGGFSQAWIAWGDLRDLMSVKLPDESRTRLPPPRESLSAVQVWARPGATGVEVLRGLSFEAKAGELVGLFGPSGAGKSTLCRVLVGVLSPTRGFVRLDGVPMDSWDFDELGPHLGYVPQSIDILDGTVAENIRRFGDHDDAATIEAAQAVGIHNVIVALPDGYDTPLFSAYGALSGGQRQRLALARAIYKWPRFLILDEPNANLDLHALRSLGVLLDQLKARGSIIVLATHEPALLRRCDRLVVIRNGKTLKVVTPPQVLDQAAIPSESSQAQLEHQEEG